MIRACVGAVHDLEVRLVDRREKFATRAQAQVLRDIRKHQPGFSVRLEVRRRTAEESAQQTALQSGRNAPLVLGVTVLTSMDNRALNEIGCEADVGKHVERLAALAMKAGLRGLVCSPLEIVSLRQMLPQNVQLVTPGIRTGAEKADDQKRTLTPKEALDAGANWLVIGRPIYAAENPRAAAEKILESLGH